MIRWLIMPRGINVGKYNRVPMPELKQSLLVAGFVDVVTIGRSGNIIATKPGTEKELTALVHELILTEFGIDVPVIVRSDAEVRAVLKVNPLAQPATDGSKYLAIFLSESPAIERVTALETQDFSPEVFKIVDRTAFV